MFQIIFTSIIYVLPSDYLNFFTNTLNFAQTPNPTPQQISIPPSAGARWSQAMIGIVLIAVLIVIIGVWVNRDSSEKQSS